MMGGNGPMNYSFGGGSGGGGGGRSRGGGNKWSDAQRDGVHAPPRRKRDLPADLRKRRTWNRLFRYVDHQSEDGDPERHKAAPVTGKSLRTFWAFVKPHLNLVWLLALTTVITQGMTVVMPVAIGQVLDHVLPRHDGMLLNMVAAGLVVFILLRAFYLFLSRELSALTGSLVVDSVRNRMHQHMQAMSLRFLEDYQVGRIVSRIMSDTEAIRNLLVGGFVNTAANVLRLVFVVGTLAWIDWRLFLVSCFTMPFFVAGFAHHVRRLRPAHKELSEDRAILWAKASETFNGIRVVKTYGSEKREDLSFMKRIHEMLRKGLLVRHTHHTMAVIWEISAWLGMVALIWYGGHRVMTGAMSVGELVAFYGLLGMMHGPVAELINVSESVQAAMASIERITEVLDQEPEIADRPGAREAGVLHGAVRFRDVSFRYKESNRDGSVREEADPDKRRRAVEHIDLDVKPGECVALVGHSGSGKSTTINLLARFYDVDEGAIEVDGVDVRDYRLASYRRNLAIVLQESFLFQGTIRENIAYSRPGASEDEIVRAAKMAGAWEFIQKSEHGLDSYCGERGCKLSGGQKQRLTIARAILADPRILILDEATSALDSKTETEIQAALDGLMRHRTTFVIAHRLSTIIHADKIVVMKDGQIAETGTHEELLAREGHYFDLFMEQYGKVRFTGRTAEMIHAWRTRQPRDGQDQPGAGGEEMLPVPGLISGEAQMLERLAREAEGVPAHAANEQVRKLGAEEQRPLPATRSGLLGAIRRRDARSGKVEPATAD